LSLRLHLFPRYPTLPYSRMLTEGGVLTASTLLHPASS
jgi:hypothetical protein